MEEKMAEEKIVTPEETASEETEVKTENAEGYKELIEKVLKTEDLSNLLEYLPTII